MDRITFNKELVLSKKRRNSYSKLVDFINGDMCYEGKIMVLYGLRRTGKTTMIEQAIAEYPAQEQCVLYEVTNNDSIEDIKKQLVKDIDSGIKVIALDEITKAKDFISEASVLSDVYAKEGIRIVITGTDSLGLLFAQNEELFDRTISINTTHISFAEHCKVLNTKDIDDYITYGGMMQKGKDGDRSVYDIKSALTYLDSAVSGNISRSLKIRSEDSILNKLTEDDIKTIIEKMVEIYSGIISIKNTNEPLKNSTVNYPVHFLTELVDNAIVNKLSLESRAITHEFSEKINAAKPLSTTVTEQMISELEDYLTNMQILSVVNTVKYDFNESIGWRSYQPKHEYYIVQPAIKYFHLREACKFIESKPYYINLTNSQKHLMQQKLDEKIKGDMTEQIIVFDLQKQLPKEQYDVCKTEFYNNGIKYGEYDMLVHDFVHNKYWGFEIKHSSKPYPDQEAKLQDRHLAEVIDTNYGKRENVCVLYRGNSLISPSGTLYLNITDFMLSVEKNRDMDVVINEMTSTIAKAAYNQVDFESDKDEDEDIDI